MVGYTGKQHYLLKHAVNLRNIGWNVGLARKDKTLMADFRGARKHYVGQDWDAISIMLDTSLVVVDIDARHWTLPPHCVLPPTLKERTRKGWHLYYDLPENGDYRCLIKRWENVDLLIAEDRDIDPQLMTQYEVFYIDGEEMNPWVSHVLCAPSDNYELVYPDVWLPRMEITKAPDWLVDEVSA